MLIAFEGPDYAGKSTSAANLTSFEKPIYNATKENHAELAKAVRSEPGLVGTFDRIDWLTHMVYRLALPGAEWSDARVRTVFAMPDTHLVLKIHKPELAEFVADEAVHTPIGEINPVYFYVIDFLSALNRVRGYTLFKSVTVMEVENTSDGYKQRLVDFDSASFGFLDVLSHMSRLVETDEDLLEMLRWVDGRS